MTKDEGAVLSVLSFTEWKAGFMVQEELEEMGTRLSLGTIRIALDRLETQGFVESRPRPIFLI